jgi:hypothetical protein
MKKIVWLCSVAMAGALMCGDAFAVGKAGLWNAAMTMQLASAPQIPPEALAQMRALGIAIPGMGGAPIRTQVCMSPEQAAANSPPPPQNGCRNQNIQVNGNTITGELVCTGEMSGTGTFTFTQVNADEMRNNFTFKGTNRGQPADFSADMVLTYANANCGNVRPFAP